MKILLIEDSKGAALVISALMKKMYPLSSLDLAEDGDVALDRVSNRNYDLILCDYQLPGVNGDKVVIRAKELAQSGKIIAISSTTKYNDLLKSIGAVDGIEKDLFLEAFKKDCKDGCNSTLDQIKYSINEALK